MRNIFSRWNQRDCYYYVALTSPPSRGNCLLWRASAAERKRKTSTMFRDRKDAGAQLASGLLKYKDNKDALVLALPRGGVVTGYEVARALGVPLDILIVRKIGVPWQPELAAAAL